VKIAIVSTFYPYRGGIAQFNACLYAELKEQGHEVMAFNFKRQYPSLLFPGKTQYVEVNDSADGIESSRILDSINPFSWESTFRQVKAAKPDLVIVRYWMSFLAPSLGYVCGKLKKSGIPILAITDNIIPHETKVWDRPMARYFLKRVNAFVAMNQEVNQEVKSLCPGLEGITLHHPIYDHFGAKLNREEALKRLKIPSDRKVLLFFGLIRDYKGLDILLDAFAGLSGDYHLIIAGEAYGDFSGYQRKIDESPLKDNISCFNEYIPDQKVPVFFSASDLVVLPYRSATQSGITAVAFHFEVPVIVTDVGGLSEVIQHEKTGLIVDKPEVSLIHDAILRFFKLRESTDFTGNIRNHVKSFSWSAFVEALLKFSGTIK
jgi:glycosyltransferase involved in cell wall biosynthesis